MNLKQYTRFSVNFDSKWIAAASAMMGLSFFLRIVYYFALVSLRDVGFIELMSSVIIGILLCGGFVVCLQCLRMNAPGLYGMIGAAQCLMIIILSFTTGDAWRIVLAIIWYVLTGLILLATVGGYLPGRLLAAVMFVIPLVVRFFFYDIGHIGLIRWVQELAVLSILVALPCFVMGLTAKKR